MDWGKILTDIMLAMITVFLPVFLSFLLRWIRDKVNYMNQLMADELGASNWEFVKALADDFVLAAEQRGVWDKLLSTGADKKVWVIQRMQEALRARGLNVDLEQIDAAIELAVWQALKE